MGELAELAELAQLGVEDLLSPVIVPMFQCGRWLGAESE